MLLLELLKVAVDNRRVRPRRLPKLNRPRTIIRVGIQPLQGRALRSALLA
jgi:hypothetical protein